MKIDHFYYKADVREPYMGNTMEMAVILGINRETRMIVSVHIVTTGEQISTHMRQMTREEFDELFNH